jgi:hypothetical protein
MAKTSRAVYWQEHITKRTEEIIVVREDLSLTPDTVGIIWNNNLERATQNRNQDVDFQDRNMLCRSKYTLNPFNSSIHKKEAEK